jgi:hypothetical protein
MSSALTTDKKMSSIVSTAIESVLTTTVIPKLNTILENQNEQKELLTQFVLGKNQNDEKDEKEQKIPSVPINQNEEESSIQNHERHKPIQNHENRNRRLIQNHKKHKKNHLPTHLKKFRKTINGQCVKVIEISNRKNYPDYPTKIRRCMECKDRIYLVEYPKNSTTNEWVEENIRSSISIAINQFENSGKGIGDMIIEKYAYEQDGQWITVERVEHPIEIISGYRVIRSFGQLRYQEMRKIVSENLDNETLFRVSFEKNSVTKKWIGTSYGVKNSGKIGYPHLIHMNILGKVKRFEGR